MKFLLKFLLRLFFRFRAYNLNVLDEKGPVILVANHVSWLDWLFLGVCLDNDWKFVTSRVTAALSPIHRLIMTSKRTFPVDPFSPYSVKQMTQYLRGGRRLVFFAEGRISVTGSLMKIQEGTGFLLQKTKAKVIIAYLRGAHRIKWVRHTGWTKWFHKVEVHFCGPFTPPDFSAYQGATARAKLARWLRNKIIEHQYLVEMEHGPKTIIQAINEIAQNMPGARIIEDINRKKLSYRSLFTAVDLFSEKLKFLISSTQSKRVGILLPNTIGFVVSILGLWRLGNVPVVLNYSLGMDSIISCAQLAGLKEILTARKFLDRLGINPDKFVKNGINIIFVEDIAESINWVKKVVMLIKKTIRPKLCVEADPDSTAVILYTSGSESVPKGVELSHKNILANIRQLILSVDVVDSDRMFTALPVFHSFGLVLGTILPLVRGIYVFLYPTPLHYGMIPVALYDVQGTILLSTNTFLKAYGRKAHPADFRSLRLVFAGAEKLQETTFILWAKKFGVRVLEGYGVTECSPCISVNTPMDPRFGTAGRILPGIDYRLEKVDGVESGGRLLVRGDNVMKGYLNINDNARFQALGGWYDTGDIVEVDEDGFVKICGRLKRFAKVGGEMVSLARIEDALNEEFLRYGQKLEIAVTSIQDSEKGERIIVVANSKKVLLEDVRRVLRTKQFPILYFPREIYYVKEIPKLGTGKPDYRSLMELVKTLRDKE